MGSDQSHHGGLRPGTYFNPRSPDGERRCVGSCSTGRGDFNPRSPDGERHVLQHADQRMRVISIHAPRMGSDQATTPTRRPCPYFNPRSPDGERHALGVQRAAISKFQSTLPGWGATRENGHLRPRYGQNHPFSTLIVSQIVVDVLGTVRKSQKHQRTSHYEVIKQPERQK